MNSHRRRSWATRAQGKTRVVLSACAAALVAVVAAPTLTVAHADEPEEPREAFTIGDERIVESSGLTLSTKHPNTFYTVNDSGDEARVFALDDEGTVVGVIRLAEVDVHDVEAVASGPDERIWVADIGDNDRVRETITLYRFREPEELGDVQQQWSRFPLVYPDGPHDAEALLVHPETGQPFIVTKDPEGGAIYAAPEEPVSGAVENELVRVADAPAVVTDGAFLPDGSGVVLRTYGEAYLLDWPSGEVVRTIPLPPQRQGESLAISEDGKYLYAGSEGANSVVNLVPLDAEAPPASPSPTATAKPTKKPKAGPANEKGGAEDADPDGEGLFGGLHWAIPVAVVVVAVGAGALAFPRVLAFRRRSGADDDEDLPTARRREPSDGSDGEPYGDGDEPDLAGVRGGWAGAPEWTRGATTPWPAGEQEWPASDRAWADGRWQGDGSWPEDARRAAADRAWPSDEWRRDDWRGDDRSGEGRSGDDWPGDDWRRDDRSAGDWRTDQEWPEVRPDEVADANRLADEGWPARERWHADEAWRTGEEPLADERWGGDGRQADDRWQTPREWRGGEWQGDHAPPTVVPPDASRDGPAWPPDEGPRERPWPSESSWSHADPSPTTGWLDETSSTSPSTTSPSTEREWSAPPQPVGQEWSTHQAQPSEPTWSREPEWSSGRGWSEPEHSSGAEASPHRQWSPGPPEWSSAREWPSGAEYANRDWRGAEHDWEEPQQSAGSASPAWSPRSPADDGWPGEWSSRRWPHEAGGAATNDPESPADDFRGGGDADGDWDAPAWSRDEQRYAPSPGASGVDDPGSQGWWDHPASRDEPAPGRSAWGEEGDFWESRGPEPQRAQPPWPHPQAPHSQGPYPQGAYPQAAYPEEPYPQETYPEGTYPERSEPPRGSERSLAEADWLRERSAWRGDGERWDPSASSAPRAPQPPEQRPEADISWPHRQAHPWEPPQQRFAGPHDEDDFWSRPPTPIEPGWSGEGAAGTRWRSDDNSASRRRLFRDEDLD